MYLIRLNNDEYKDLYDYMYPIWHETYKNVIPTEQIDFLLNKYFKLDNINSFINKGYEYFKIFDNELIGYVVINELTNEIYLDKLYISGKFRGLGYPSKVFKYLLMRNKDITLNVNQENKRAINCYKKNGFLIEEIEIINLGDGMVNKDYRMRLFKNYNVINVLNERRSVRSFSNKDISDDILNEIVKTGLYAPSAMGRQETKMLVVKNKDLVKELSRLNANVMGRSDDPFYNANVVVVVFSNSDDKNYIQNGSLVMMNLMNAAYALNVDSIWINRAYEMFNSEEGLRIKEKYNIPNSYVGVGNCCLGYRDIELPLPKERLENRIIIVE